MPSNDSSEAWAAFKEAEQTKELTEMIKVIGVVAVILGLAFLVGQSNRRRSILRGKTANIAARALNLQHTQAIRMNQKSAT